jgi:hypothetical protein
LGGGGGSVGAGDRAAVFGAEQSTTLPLFQIICFALRSSSGCLNDFFVGVAPEVRILGVLVRVDELGMTPWFSTTVSIPCLN